jgi:hypothetical protein
METPNNKLPGSKLSIEEIGLSVMQECRPFFEKYVTQQTRLYQTARRDIVRN